MDIIRIPERFMRANSYVIKIGDDYTLIDPGIAPAALDQTVGEVISDKITRLVVTHPHYDHIVYMDHWRDKFNMPIFIHENAPAILENPDLNASTVFGRDVQFNINCSLIREGAKIQLADGFYLTSVFLPGHSAADVLFTLRRQGEVDPRAIFAGDIVFADSVGRTDLAGGNASAQQVSLQRLARLLMLWPSDTVVYAGHGHVFTVGDALEQNAFVMAAAEQVRRKSGVAVDAAYIHKPKQFSWPRKQNLIAYVGTNDLKRVTIPDALDMDIINIAFGIIREGLAWWQPDADAINGLNRLRAIHPGIRIVLSIGGWGAGGFSEMAATAKGRARFAQSCVRLVKDYGLDGIDLDWEYPGSSAAGIASMPEDKENFTYLLQDLRDALDAIGGRYYQLSIAAGANESYIARTEMDQVAKILDYVQIMTYDLGTAYGKVSGHHTNLYPSEIYAERVKESSLAERFRDRFADEGDVRLAHLAETSADQSVRAYIEAGVPAEKLVIGAAFYGRTFKGVVGGGDGLAMEAGGDNHAGPDYDVLTPAYLAEHGFKRYWDESAKAPWLFNGSTFISYDDPESLAEKAKYSMEKGLGGVMYWVYDTAYHSGLNHILRLELDQAAAEDESNAANV